MLDNTKQALKIVGKDAVDVVKATGKLAKDICISLPKAAFDDGRAHLEQRKAFLAWLKAEDSDKSFAEDVQ